MTDSIDEITKTTPNAVIGNVSLEIGNGGINFAIEHDEKFGPRILIRHSQFGNIGTTTEILTDPDGLEALAKLFTMATRWKHDKTYCHAAKPWYKYDEGRDAKGRPILVAIDRPIVKACGNCSDCTCNDDEAGNAGSGAEK